MEIPVVLVVVRLMTNRVLELYHQQIKDSLVVMVQPVDLTVVVAVVASALLVAMLHLLKVVMVELDYRLQSLDLLLLQRVLVHQILVQENISGLAVVVQDTDLLELLV
jgi:hypothetical protein|tara:strand:+ start:564 stop:887 length:324 start_codon:yes stop_codon:yes gene_type:complete